VLTLNTKYRQNALRYFVDETAQQMDGLLYSTSPLCRLLTCNLCKYMKMKRYKKHYVNVLETRCDKTQFKIQNKYGTLVFPFSHLFNNMCIFIPLEIVHTKKYADIGIRNELTSSFLQR
jgi:hypothetical protein